MGISSALGSSALLPAGLGFRNMVINGGFDIWQRGTSFTNPASATGFTADRFFPVYDGSGATRTISQGQFDPYLSGATITATPPAGTSPTYFLRWAQSVAGTGATYNILYNRVENVRLLAGQTVTLSFYAKAASNLTMPTIDIEQYFGAGGSPSANVYTTVTSNVAVTTSWQRFTFTFQIPSAAGKVIGTADNSSYTSIRLWLPINTTFTYDIWGLQLERNYQPTPFEQRPIGAELQLCQRYYVRWQMITSGGYHRLPSLMNTYSASAAQGMIWHPVPMRNLNGPTSVEYFGVGITDNATFDSGFGTVTLNTSNSSAYTSMINIASIAGTVTQGTGRNLELSNASSYLGLSAEL